MSEVEQELRALGLLVEAEHDRLCEDPGNLGDNIADGMIDALGWVCDLIDARLAAIGGGSDE